jgi:hypothetical protein
VFENRVLRRIFGPNIAEVMGDWRKVHNEELHNLYSSLMEDEMGRTCSMNGENRIAYRILVGKSEGNRLLGRQRRRWLDNIKIDLREIGWDDMD